MQADPKLLARERWGAVLVLLASCISCTLAASLLGADPGNGLLAGSLLGGGLGTVVSIGLRRRFVAQWRAVLEAVAVRRGLRVEEQRIAFLRLLHLEGRERGVQLRLTWYPASGGRHGRRAPPRFLVQAEGPVPVVTVRPADGEEGPDRLAGSDGFLSVEGDREGLLAALGQSGVEPLYRAIVEQEWRLQEGRLQLTRNALLYDEETVEGLLDEALQVAALFGRH